MNRARSPTQKENLRAIHETFAKKKKKNLKNQQKRESDFFSGCAGQINNTSD